MTVALVPSMALCRHQQSPCSKAFQRILIDHLRTPDTLTTVFFPGVLQPPVLSQPWDLGGVRGPPMDPDPQPLTPSLLVDYE
jgi:hypothetical protein